MNIRSILSLVLVFATLALGACAGPIKMLPDGKRCLGNTTAGDTLDRSTSYSAIYHCHKEGERLIVGDEVKPGDMVHGQTVAGQLAVGVGTAVAGGATQGLFGVKIAKTGRCPAGSVCPGGTLIQNQVQAVADALLQNQVGIDVGVGGTCAATNSCGK